MIEREREREGEGGGGGGRGRGRGEREREGEREGGREREGGSERTVLRVCVGGCVDVMGEETFSFLCTAGSLHFTPIHCSSRCVCVCVWGFVCK